VDEEDNNIVNDEFLIEKMEFFPQFEGSTIEADKTELKGYVLPSG
jgi:hypothetical protein